MVPNMIIHLIWPPPCNSDHQDYYMFSRGFLLTFTFHCYREGAISKSYTHISTIKTQKKCREVTPESIEFQLHSQQLTWRAPKWWALENVTGPLKNSNCWYLCWISGVYFVFLLLNKHLEKGKTYYPPKWWCFMVIYIPFWKVKHHLPNPETHPKLYIIEATFSNLQLTSPCLYIPKKSFNQPPKCILSVLELWWKMVNPGHFFLLDTEKSNITLARLEILHFQHFPIHNTSSNGTCSTFAIFYMFVFLDSNLQNIENIDVRWFHLSTEEISGSFMVPFFW